MRRLALLFLCLSTSVQAQDQPPTSRPTAGERVVLVAGSLGGGAVVGVALGPAAPLGIAAGTYGAARLLGLDVSGGDLLVETALGTLVGVGTTAGTYWIITEVSPRAESLGLALTSIAVGVTAAAVTTALRVDAQPAVLTAPTGEPAPGLSLRVGL